MSFAAVEPITATDISGTYDNTKQTYDCTALIPSGMTASGVLIRYKYSASTSSDNVGFYRGDSTDTYQWRANTKSSATWEYCAVGLDSADDTFDYTINGLGAGTPTVQVVGFFNSSYVKFFQNATTYTPGNAVYADVDISAATGGDTAVAGIFHIYSQRSSAILMAWRKKGSSDDIYGTVGKAAANGGVGMAIVGVDGSEVCQFKQSSSFGGASAYLVGYFTGGISFNDPASDKSTGTTGSYQSVSVTSGAVMAYVEMIHTSNTDGISQGVTGDSSGDDTYGAGAPYIPSLIEVITTDTIYQKIASTSQDLYMRATIDAAAGGGDTTGYPGYIPTLQTSVKSRHV